MWIRNHYKKNQQQKQKPDLQIIENRENDLENRCLEAETIPKSYQTDLRNFRKLEL